MEQIQANSLAQNVDATLSGKVQKNSRQNTKLRNVKIMQLGESLDQCYSTYKVFKSPEDAKNNLKAFMMVLEDVALEDISYAFRAWLKTQPEMPVPSNIRGPALENARSRNQPKYTPVQLSTPKEREYIVPWAYMTWVQIEKAGMIQDVMDHVEDLRHEKGNLAANNYLKYVKSIEPTPFG